MTGAAFRAEIAPFALRCPSCGNGPVAPPSTLLTTVEAGYFVCPGPGCTQRTPLETSYVEAQRALPFTNIPLVSNRWELGVTEVPVGRLHTVEVAADLQTLDWVNASANAEFPASVAIVQQASDRFTVLVGTPDPPAADSVRVAWSAVGTDRKDRPFFFDALARAMQALHRAPLRRDQDMRLALLEAVSAYEIFLAWYLRNTVWKHPHFEQSRTKARSVEDMIREAGVYNLTSVALRVAYRDYDPYRILQLLQFKAVGGILTVDDAIEEMLAGIRLRNKVAHKGLTGIDVGIVERTTSAAYRLMELGLLHLPDASAAGGGVA